MIDDVQRSLGRIEGKLDNLLDSQKNHDNRIISLENDRNRVKGALWGVGLTSGGLGAFIAKIFPFGAGH